MDMDTDKNIHSAPCRVLSKVGNNTFAYKKKKTHTQIPNRKNLPN